jgi:hypothetical protein
VKRCWQLTRTSTPNASRFTVGAAVLPLNLLLYPELYQTGIAVAAVANQLRVTIIFTKNVMGVTRGFWTVVKEFTDYTLNLEEISTFTARVTIMCVPKRRNVVNEPKRKRFQFMAYPNRSHGTRRRHRRHLDTSGFERQLHSGKWNSYMSQARARRHEYLTLRVQVV